MRSVLLPLGGLLLTTLVIGNAYYQKKQFYPSVVYITKSNPSMAVIYCQAFIMVVLTGKLMKKVFFGQLRAAEFEHLMERSWYAVTETCLAFTVFRDDFSPKFVALFTVLLFLKSFHWLAEDRVDFMERSPVISWLFHLRVISLLTLLGSLDIHFVSLAYQSTVTKGASVQLVFGFEYAILLTIIINISIKYILHTIDMYNENPWENKAVYLLYTELVMGFIKVVLYATFVAIMVRIYTLPLFAFRPMYYTMRAFKKALKDVILSRRAIRNMNTLYPDATPEELAAGDNVCIICREEMVTASKKLPCNHIFHTACLRSWFQRQQTCPTCRLNVLRAPTPPVTPAAAAPQPAAQQAQQTPQPQPPQQQPPFPPNQFQNLFAPGGFPGPFPMWPPFQPPMGVHVPNQQGEQQQQQAPAGSSEGGTPAAAATSGSTAGPPPSGQDNNSAGSSAATSGPGQSQAQQPMPNFPFFLPPFPFMPFTVPPPVPPTDFTGLNDDEVRQMEGTSRASVEARIRCMRNIQILLDAAVTMMQQYAAAAATANVAQMNFSTQRPTTRQPSPPPQPSASPSPEPQPSTSSTLDSDSRPKDTVATSGENTDDASSLSSRSETRLDPEQEEIRRRRLEKFTQAQEGGV